MKNSATTKNSSKFFLKTVFVVVGIMMLPISIIAIIKRGLNNSSSYSFIANADIPAEYSYSQGYDGSACQGFDPSDPNCCNNTDPSAGATT